MIDPDSLIPWAAIVGVCSMLDIDPDRVSHISIDANSREVVVESVDPLTFTFIETRRYFRHPARIQRV